MIAPIRTDARKLVPSSAAPIAAPYDAAVAWRWRIEVRTTDEELVLSPPPDATARAVEVLLDDRSPAEHAAVHGAPGIPGEVAPGTELRFAYVLPARRRPFARVRIRWTDEEGGRREVEHVIAIPLPPG